MKFIDLTGRKYDRLTVIGLSGKKNKTNHYLWSCLCECGNIIEVAGTSLNTLNTRSCGCFRSEELTRTRSIHSDSNSVEHRLWRNIKDRCYNPNNSYYNCYGGRGITICDAWKNNYQAFIAYVGRKPPGMKSLDRINNDGNYEPGNVRWATDVQQATNKRATIFITNGAGERISFFEQMQRLSIPKSKYDYLLYKKKLTHTEIYNLYKN
jgi:hypothetical protein